jgi:hypothetical protein
MNDFDYMYLSFIGDQLIKQKDCDFMIEYWVKALKEHVSFLSKRETLEANQESPEIKL